MPPPPELTRAIDHHRAGRLAEAATLYRSVLAAYPTAADALHLLGVVAYQSRDFPTAERLIGRAIALAQDVAVQHANLGNVFYDQNRLPEAEAAYRQALILAPQLPPALYGLANALSRRSQPAEAVEFYRAAIAVQPNYADAHNNLGKALRVLGRTDDAVEAFRAALRHAPTHARAQANLTAALADLKPAAPAPELNRLITAAVTAVRAGDPEHARIQAEAAVLRYPSSAEAHFTLGWVVHEAGRPKQAETHYRAALRCDPLHVSALTNLANVLTELRRDAESLACAQRALAIRPDHASAWNAVGSALFELDHAAEAAAAYRRALALAPANARASNNLGAALQTLGRPEEAAGHYLQATAAHPGYVQAHSNLGAAMLDQGRLDEALEHLDKAVAVDPRDADSRLNRAFVRLMQGDYRQGWDDYEWRWQARRFPSPLRHTGRPLWSGEPLDGRTILLHAEQGFGDCLQFLRYVPLVAERGGRIVLEVQKELKRLVTGFPGVTTLIGRDEPIPPFDLQAPLLSLPRAFGTTPQTVPAAIPYLSADPERVTTWRRRLPADSLRIGIVWQGNPTARIDRGRSIPLHHFAPLAAIPGVRLIGLQQRHGLDQLKTLPAGMTVTIPGDDIDTGGNAFLDTAAIMTTLDLIVTSDTASAHLAGALGVPVWVALKFVPDWRWLAGRTDTPWYPTMRLFRQPRPGDWNSVFAAMTEALAGLL